MPYHYSDPERASEPHALPNVNTWQDHAADCACGCVYPADCDVCPDCGATEREEVSDAPLWWYAFGFPGCLNDSDPTGPFNTEEDAIASAREMAEG